VRVRDGHTGAREEGTIGFATLRGGGVIGDHQVIFANDAEMITLSHRANDRSLFAQGALAAARFVCGKPPGRYVFKDVLA
jgi:4-hydroxy-tetrahydrodipicolinate reductase